MLFTTLGSHQTCYCQVELGLRAPELRYTRVSRPRDGRCCSDQLHRVWGSWGLVYQCIDEGICMTQYNMYCYLCMCIGWRMSCAITPMHTPDLKANRGSMQHKTEQTTIKKSAAQNVVVPGAYIQSESQTRTQKAFQPQHRGFPVGHNNTKLSTCSTLTVPYRVRRYPFTIPILPSPLRVND